MGLAIHLLGTPTAERDGEPVTSPKGRKAWGLIAYLVCVGRPVSRGHLAQLLCAEADDPLGALRWNLTQVRRMIGDPQTLRATLLELRLPSGTFVDVHAVTRGTWLEGSRVPGLGRDLLEGLDFSSSPAFDAWLMSERRHVRAASEAMLREAALAQLGAGNPAAAAELAARLVQLDPIDEGFQALLIRALLRSGDRRAAAQQFDTAAALLRTELGVEPGPELVAAAGTAATAVARPTPAHGADPVEARSELDAGQAALAAGDIEPGLRHLQRAIAAAHRCGGVETQVEALVALGSSLISAVRSRDEEGAAALHEAIALAVRAGQDQMAAAACRELGFVEFLRGRYQRAQLLLEEALTLPGQQPAGRATALVLVGACLTDTADYPTALARLGEAIECAEALDDPKPLTRGLAFTARAHLLRRDLAAAREAATRAVALARTSWPTYLPWPASLLAEVDLEEGDLDRAGAGFRQAFEQGCRLGDPCWEAMAARGIGRAEALRGDKAAAIEWLLDASVRAVRLTDAYLWAQGYALDALCSVAVEHRVTEAQKWVTDLESLAARTGMRELLARAYLHRCRLGDHTADTAAALLVEEIHNPTLRDLLSTSHARSHAPTTH